jgi:hypothetical protein
VPRQTSVAGQIGNPLSQSDAVDHRIVAVNLAISGGRMKEADQ